MEGPLELDENYSQLSACLREKNGSQYQMLHELFDHSTPTVCTEEKDAKASDEEGCKHSHGGELPMTPDDLPEEDKKVQLPAAEKDEDPFHEMPPATPVQTKEKRLKRKKNNMLEDLKGASSDELASNAIVAAAEEMAASSQKVARLHAFFKPLSKEGD
eukprot:3817958-Amphidinium_carterae.1